MHPSGLAKEGSRNCNWTPLRPPHASNVQGGMHTPPPDCIGPFMPGVQYLGHPGTFIPHAAHSLRLLSTLIPASETRSGSPNWADLAHPTPNCAPPPPAQTLHC